YRGMLRACFYNEPARQARYIVPMAHPHCLLGKQAFDQRTVWYEINVRFAVFALAGLFHFAVQLVGHKLHAVANPQNWQAELINSWIYLRRASLIHAGRSP